MEGWIKLHRKMLEWEWYDDPNCFRVFMHLLIIANHKDNKWRGRLIKRGQHLTSLGKLASGTGLTVSKVRTAIQKLESTGEIASLGGVQDTVFTIKKYDEYQGDDTALAELSQANDKLMTSESQANDKPLATNKNDNKVKNEEECKELKILPTSDKSPAKKKKFTDDDARFAEWFYRGLLTINPEHKKPNFESGGWADSVRLMREQDGRAYDEMVDLFKWVLRDDFWKSIILTPKKLREKWDQLIIKAKEPNRETRNQWGNTDALAGEFSKMLNDGDINL